MTIRDDGTLEDGLLCSLDAEVHDGSRGSEARHESEAEKREEGSEEVHLSTVRLIQRL